MDITYIPMARGFIYLAAVLDWFTRRVLAWRVSITLDARPTSEGDAHQVRPPQSSIEARQLLDRTGPFDRLSLQVV